MTSSVDVVLTIDGEKDQFNQHDFAVMDALENMYRYSRSAFKNSLLRDAERALKREQGLHHTWLGRRPILMDRCLVSPGEYNEMIVVLPLGSTWPAVNKALNYFTTLGGQILTDDGLDEALRAFAHSDIKSLLDSRGMVSKYPWNVKIAYDIMYTLKMAMGKGMLGRGECVMIDSFYFEVPTPRPPTPEEGTPVYRETRQLGLVFKFKKLAL